MCNASHRTHVRLTPLRSHRFVKELNALRKLEAFRTLTIANALKASRLPLQHNQERLTGINSLEQPPKRYLVEPGRIELPTSCVQGRRSPS